MLVVPSCLPTVIPIVAPGVTVKYFSLRPPPDPAAEQQLPIDIHLGFPPPPITTVRAQTMPEGTVKVYVPGRS